MKNGIFVSELSFQKHSFNNYHFCRGNNNKRKSRLGIILKGKGTYLYLNKRLEVNEGDVVFIPENIFCYSSWQGEPDIEVLYISCFIHYEGFRYEPQTVACSQDIKDALIKIADLLDGDHLDELEAYSIFYKVLKSILPQMKQSNFAFDKTLQIAIEYLTENWDKDFSVSELAKKCLISESSLYHLFQREMGQTPVSFLNSIRINKAIEFLENTNYSVSTISDMVGFNSENHFRNVFTSLTGTTPLKFRKKT